MELLLEIINTIIYFLCVLRIGELFLGYRRKNVKGKNIIFIFISLITATIMLYSSNIWLIGIIHVIANIVIAYVYFQEEGKRLVGLYIGSMAVLSMLTMLLSIISQEIMVLFEMKEIDNVLRVINLFIVLLCIQGVGKYYENRFCATLKSINTKYWMFL